MAFSSWRGIVGVIKPTMRPGGVEDMIRLLPEGIGVIPLFNNITRGDRAEFKEVMKDYDEKVAILAEQGCDLIHPEGAPPFTKKMDIAVPANLKCGRPEDDDIPEDEPAWASLTYTIAGIWEVQPEWLEEHLSVAQILDVRETDEFDGPLGRIPGAKLIPLGALAGRVADLDKARPIVTVCRAGGRSAQATVILHRAGFSEVANLAGGMLRWRAQHCPVEGGRD